MCPFELPSDIVALDITHAVSLRLLRRTLWPERPSQHAMPVWQAAPLRRVEYSIAGT
jgi:hypothetical protein